MCVDRGVRVRMLRAQAPRVFNATPRGLVAGDVVVEHAYGQKPGPAGLYQNSRGRLRCGMHVRYIAKPRATNAHCTTQHKRGRPSKNKNKVEINHLVIGSLSKKKNEYGAEICYEFC